MIQKVISKIDHRIVLAALGLVFMIIAVNVPDLGAQANANIQQATCQGAELKFTDTSTPGGDCTFAGQDPQGELNSLIAQVINIFSVIVGVVAVIMIIVGGFRYITSGGDSGNVTSAKNTILYAIVGLVIVALAQFIVKFVLSKATA
ncbi:hypothetical protein HZB74_03580 [Candidatus Saccharibacteria bacterium]|nr:hypothetical protein [Candidatus Saccharibacteria bacterium]